MIFKGIFRADTYRNIASAAWLFFPSLFFVTLFYYAFWKLTQGKDLMLISLSNHRVYWPLILSMFFWSYTAWYSSRLVAGAKESRQDGRIDPFYLKHIPRFLAFNCYTLSLLGFLQLPYFRHPLPSSAAQTLWLFSFLYYALLNNSCYNLLYKKAADPVKMIRILLLLFVVSAILAWWTAWKPGILVLLGEMQILFMLYTMARRKIILTQTVVPAQHPFTEPAKKGIAWLFKQMIYLLRNQGDKKFFLFFNAITVIALWFYVRAILSVPAAVSLGSFPFVQLAFAVLLGFINIIACLSVLTRFNFHLIVFVVAFSISSLKEEHEVESPSAPAGFHFTNRQNLKAYFHQWVKQRMPVTVIDSAKKFPVYFVLANGGASRSGYWVASVLSSLEDSSKGIFSNHLFCLSGASGGSVGTSAFFSLLKNREEVKRRDASDTALKTAARKYLSSDFLTHTLASMLGPDFFRHLMPFIPLPDRAASLASAMEEAAAEDSAVLYRKLGAPLSGLVTNDADSSYQLPVLCINTTRMQDGTPSVISTIQIDATAFNNRVDVLSLLPEGKDLKLSSAIVLGASFPYISPAGRIDQRIQVKDQQGNPKDSTLIHYFVDGGYFDNSGAGVVNEMIIAMQQMMQDPADTLLFRYRKQLDFFLVHITNDPLGSPLLSKVNPLVNDLAAPVKTLAGAYGTQTTVNDTRLKNYLRGIYGNNQHYLRINLYQPGDNVDDYPMNWVISPQVLERMDHRLKTHQELSLFKQTLINVVRK